MVCNHVIPRLWDHNTYNTVNDLNNLLLRRYVLINLQRFKPFLFPMRMFMCPFFRENPEQFTEEKQKTKRTEAVIVMNRFTDISTSLLSSNREINVSGRFSVPEPYRRTYAIVYIKHRPWQLFRKLYTHVSDFNKQELVFKKKKRN